LDLIDRESGWEKLSTRREVKKLCMFYELNVGNSPEFLCDLIPPSVEETNTYNLRNKPLPIVVVLVYPIPQTNIPKLV
jgi:hypothetical protein